MVEIERLEDDAGALSRGLGAGGCLRQKGCRGYEQVLERERQGGRFLRRAGLLAAAFYKLRQN